MKKMMAIISAAVLTACGGDGSDGGMASSSTTLRAGEATSTGQTNETASVMSTNDFLRSEFQEGAGEILLSRLALQRATNASVRQFAQLMVDHHTRANAEIQALASGRGVSLPGEASAESQAFLLELQALSGDDFDRAYMARNVRVHNAEVSQYAAMLLAVTQRNAAGGSADTGSANGATTVSAHGTMPATQAGASATAGAEAGLAVFLTKMKAILSQHLGMAKAVNGEIDPNVWLLNAWQDGLAEIRLATIAGQRAGNAQVRQFAQMMIDEHTEANNDISRLAQTKGVTLPDEVTAEQRLAAEELARLDGAVFDKAYMNHNVIVHALDVRQTQVQASGGTDPDVRAAAARILPHLQAHLQEATSLYQALPNDLLLGAWADGLGEVLMSTLAVQRATDAEVRRFAQMMIDDHSEANAEVARLAEARGRFLPVEVSAESALAFMDAARLTGAAFDRAYMESNVTIHEKDVALFSDRAQNEPDAELRAFAAQTLPILNMHLQQARTLRDQVAGGTDAGAGGTANADTPTAMTP